MMIPTLQAQDISLGELQENFKLELTKDSQFFREWQDNLPILTDEEKRCLQRIHDNYFNLVSHGPLLEEGVKMVILSTLLDLAGFFQPPFSIKTETSVEIIAEDKGLTVRGKIDVLVLQGRLWILVIESKSTKFDVMVALPQALIYMLSNLNKETPKFAFLVNGREFVFVKLQQADIPIYSRSYSLSIERENELEQVLAILKNIGRQL